jgi:hypothetical protein
MKQLKYILLGSLFLMLPAVVQAVDLTFDADTNISLTNPSMTLVIVNGSAVDDMIVNTGSIQFTMTGGQTITIRSNEGYDLRNNTLNTGNTCTGSNSGITQLVLTLASGAAQQAVTLTPSTNVLCNPSAPSGGLGGGTPSPAPTTDITPPGAPTNIQVTDLKTGSSLKISWTKPTDSDFSSIRIYRSTSSGTLGTLVVTATSTTYTDTNLTKNQIYYYTLRSVDKSGNESTNTTQTSGTPTILEKGVTKEITGTSGGKVELTDKSAAVNIPSGAISGTASASLAPTTSYSAPPSSLTVVGNQAFNFEVKSGQTIIKNFSKKITLTFKYTESQITGLDESSLKVQYFDTSQNKWLALTGSLDTANNTITVTLDHLTLFIITGEKIQKTTAGSLVKLTCAPKAGVNDPCRSVYYLGGDSGRYVFPNEKTYYSWYADFSQVKEISASELASYQIKGNVTIRPGTYLVKITTDPKVYAVEKGGVLRWVASEAAAKKLWSDGWASKVVDVPDTFFINYQATSAVTNKITDRHPSGSLVKYKDSSSLYYVENGKKRLFTGTAFTSNGLRNEFILTIPNDLTYPSTSDITGVESLLKNTAGPS